MVLQTMWATLRHLLRFRKIWAIFAVWTVLTIGVIYRFDTEFTDGKSVAYSSPCNITSPEVLSAINRSQTTACKNEISAFGCLLQQDAVFPKVLPNSCPASSEEGDSFRSPGLRKPSEPVRILFALTVHGRDSRQVEWLFGLIHRPEHFYLIHVDKRSTFLFHDLLSLEKKYDNVLLMRERRSPIWGGASLLTVLLDAIKFGIDRWAAWDYFINLSESDLPIKSVEELVDFLGGNYGRNFAKSHGQSVQQFIKRQGLDRTFYECENRMWLVDRKRKIPQGIEMDGGSDWVALHRSFCSYLVSEPKGKLLQGLLVFYNHTLLPAESFFHTVLHNSVFCHTFTNNNLRLTNWNRKKGCYCQYRHIVDWCGCSPNAFRMANLKRFETAAHKRSLFFARKFDPFVDLEIMNYVVRISQTTSSLNQPTIGDFSDIYKSMVGRSTHILNLYASTEKHFPTQEAETLSKSLQRISYRILKTHSTLNSWKISKLLFVHATADTRGRIELLVAQQIVKNGRKKVIEARFHIVDHFEVREVKTLAKNVTSRLRGFRVSSDFDQKEDIFRNYHGALGVQSDLVGRFDVVEGEERLLSVVWIDPADIVAGSFELNLTEKAEVLFQPPVFQKPLRPGEWTGLITADWQVIVQTKFLVLPSPTPTDNQGPEGNAYIDFNFTSVSKILSLRPQDKMVAIEGNVRKSGGELERWIDELVGGFYAMKEDDSLCEVQRLSCVEEMSQLSFCENTFWSSYYDANF
ncbi:hypothetical protein RvY_11361 [Ramazzottius varieornatus]|uniref:protein xylosyltransferase n=1 Tax=Ramazzottius varieornatus TaxID=947166 RepID=A0A1D1VLB2_RAMVA|nr:hypothetical protein RvY_11361 [Ramazzottius varieornatus]